MRGLPTNRGGTRAGGFTLLEMLAVVFLMSVVLFVAIDFYLDLSKASTAATEQTRNARRAVVLLDRVARDLEGALLLEKPDEVDPLAFPWLFLADATDPDAGADRVKFVRRGHRPRSSDAAESDLELVSWQAVESPDGDLELLRWSWPRLPEGLDRSFPPVEESQLVAGGLASFGIRFVDESGAWSSRWDSTTLVGSSELPLAAEIEVAFFADAESDAVDGPYLRRVLLPLRPIDLQAQLERAGGAQPGSGELEDENGDGVIDEADAEIAAAREAAEEDEEPGCVTVAQCLAENPALQAQVEAFGEQAAAIVQGSLGQCARDFGAVIPLPPGCLQ